MKKLNKKERIIFWAGAYLGIIGGVVGNILTSSAFNLINNNCQSKLCFRGTIFLFIISAILFYVITYYIIKQIKQN